MSLILKSNKKFSGAIDFTDFIAYRDRVIADGGVINNSAMLIDAFVFMKNNSFNSSRIFSATSANWGVKISGGLIVKLYSLFGADGDMLLGGVGGFPINQKNGVYSFVSNITDNKNFQSVGRLNNPNVTLSLSFEYIPTTPLLIKPIAEISLPESQGRFVNVGVNSVTGNYSSNSHGSSGEVEGIPNNHDITITVNASSLVVYQGGVEVVRDSTVTPITATGTQFVLAAGNSSVYYQTINGNHYAAIVGLNMTDAESKVLSKFTSSINPV